MHYVMAKGILSAGGNINLYRGCTHGCIYCDSRSRCYHIDHAFEDVEVKQNAVELLEDALRRRRAPCMVGTGSMTDPYLPLEAELRLTRRAMEVVERYGCGFTVITKSDLILRDLDLLSRIQQNAKCVVQMTLTTADETLCRKLEPNVCTTARRCEVLRELQKAGIRIEVGDRSAYRTDKRPVRMEYLDDISLPEFSHLPTFKRICICILKNDHACKYMGFAPNKSETQRRNKIMEKYESLL